MRFLVLVILLAFPIIDLFATLRFARWSGVPIWVWLALSTVSGLWLLRNERDAFRVRIVAALHGEQPLMRGVVDSGRKVLAGFLLLLPGLVSDLIALALLMLPINTGQGYEPQPVAAGRGTLRRGDALDGEYRRIE
jgi:UPF0716 protein FxsA